MSQHSTDGQEQAGSLPTSTESPQEPKPIKCPHCEKDIHLSLGVAFKPYKLTMELTQEANHKLQASTLGGMLTDMQKLLKASAKSLGGDVELLVDNIVFAGDKIAVDFLCVENRNQRKKKNAGRDPLPTGSDAEQSRPKVATAERGEG